MEVEIRHAKSGKLLATVGGFSSSSTIGDIKLAYAKLFPKYYPDRQAYKAEKSGKMLKDDFSIKEFPKSGTMYQLYFKDLGPQIGWSTVFLCEYMGPLITYLIFYSRPAIIYGNQSRKESAHFVVHIAAACWTFHYAKRVLETIFIHRFSHNTMPVFNLFKNCSYYWGFAAFVSYYVNHPLYTPPSCEAQIYGGLAGFIFSELGNLSIHVALRNLRPAGSKVRKIPFPTGNPFTMLFNCVACPNYTYEVLAWLSFSIMTQCIPALLFTITGYFQMMVWAKGKLRNYKKEFPKFPKGRKAILPFLV